MARGAIDTYLDELLASLRGPASDVRATLEEAESHLRERAAAMVADGLEPEEAERRAVARFGPAVQIAGAENRVVRGRSVVSLLAVLCGQAARMAMVGFTAVGAAAVVSLLLARVTSDSFVFGLPESASIGAESCAHWFSSQPGADSCAIAATMANRDDTGFLWITSAVAGILFVGGGLLLSSWIARWRGRVPRSRTTVLPAGMVSAVGAAVFGMAAALLVVAAGTDIVVAGIWGQGLLLVCGIVSLMVAGCYAAAFVRTCIGSPREVRVGATGR